MDLERDMLIELSVADQVVNKDFFEELCYTEPLASSILLDGFEQFLLDSRFKPLERQLVLLKFLRNNYPLDIARRIIETVSNSFLSQDYTRVIMEWNYLSSEIIKQEAVEVFDTFQFGFDKSTKIAYDEERKAAKRKLNSMNQLTTFLVDNLNDDE